MRILLFGASGQLGHELQQLPSSLVEMRVCGRDEVDFMHTHTFTKVIDDFKPDVIVNAAAYTAVDKAESERDIAFQINSVAVGVLANEAAKRNIWLIHYSTDYVFDGAKKEPYSETDMPNPINIYGQSKLAGEQEIISSGCKHLIFRIAWLIGKDGSNFAKTILSLACQRNSLNIINDQFGAPTSSVLVKKVTADAVQAMTKQIPWPMGIYHLAPHGQTTWHGIAEVILQQAQEAQLPLRVSKSALQPITAAEYSSPAKRPANSRLCSGKLERHISFSLPNWEDDFFMIATEIIKEFKII